MATDDDVTLRNANDSGFPLQIAVARQVNETSLDHGWRVRYTEHSWSNSPEGNQSGFIDLVLEDKHRSSFAVIECKRVRDTEWIFLHSAGRAPSERSAKGWVSRYANGNITRFGWHDLWPYPACVEAEYCVIRGQSGHDKATLLERLGGELIEATEALAAEERDFRSNDFESIKLYLTLIVTTADLKLGTFDPSKISLIDGKIPDATFESVPFLRFRKQLSAKRNRLLPSDYEAKTGSSVAHAKEHTIFVIRADALPRFLKDLHVPPNNVLG
jgi:hypothetical protein